VTELIIAKFAVYSVSLVFLVHNYIGHMLVAYILTGRSLRFYYNRRAIFNGRVKILSVFWRYKDIDPEHQLVHWQRQSIEAAGYIAELVFIAVLYALTLMNDGFFMLFISYYLAVVIHLLLITACSFCVSLSSRQQTASTKGRVTARCLSKTSFRRHQ
jgi:hypothetical protein